jgi:hypothetical protein
MIRYVVAFVSLSVGIVVGTIEFIACIAISPQAFVAIAKKDLEGMAITMGLCATGFAVAYSVARVLYERVGAVHDLAQLKQFARGHLALLHVMSAGYMVVAIVSATRGGNWLSPSLIIGTFLFALTVWELFRVWRIQRQQLASCSRGGR